MEEDLAKALRGEPNAEWGKDGQQTVGRQHERNHCHGQGRDRHQLGNLSPRSKASRSSNPSHWFTPFNKRRPEVKSIFPPGVRHNPIQMLMEASNFCESDKYSLCMMLNQIAPSQRDMMISSNRPQIEGNKERSRDVAKEGFYMNIWFPLP